MPICIIPARGGSKRVPRKNILPLAGRPLIAHSVHCALESGLFRDVVVSTDDDEIAEVSRIHGASVPFRRAAHLADDNAGTAEVVADAIIRLAAYDGEHVCCLYPTAPLVRPDNLRDAYAIARREGVDSVIAVTEFDFPPLRAYRQTGDGHLAFQWPEHELTRSQDLPHMFHDAGAFYWLRTAPFLKRLRLTGPASLPYFMPRLSAVDIDTHEDVAFAEMLLELRSRNERP
jgi:N-acylneuraminate cytidylyltransferase